MFVQNVHGITAYLDILSSGNLSDPQQSYQEAFFTVVLQLMLNFFTNLNWNCVCGCDLRPLENQGASTCACGSESGCACVRPEKWSQLTPWN